VPPVEGPCLADEPTDCDDRVGEVEERVDDILIEVFSVRLIRSFGA
jgi:hypothetical protein